MKKLYFIIEVTFFLVFGLTLQGQNTIPAAGNNAGGIGGYVSYTVGQVVYSTCNGATGSATLGVQQPFEISVITFIEQAKDIALVCTAYPNPASDLLTLKVKNFSTENLSCQLLNANGNILDSKSILNSETVISLKGLPASLYFLKIIDGHREIKTIKIIKN